MKFKCKLSGTVVEFTSEYDIQAMLVHTGYEVVEDKPVEKEITKVVKPVKD